MNLFNLISTAQSSSGFLKFIESLGVTRSDATAIATRILKNVKRNPNITVVEIADLAVKNQPQLQRLRKDITSFVYDGEPSALIEDLKDIPDISSKLNLISALLEE
jgi:hypothetical protein